MVSSDMNGASESGKRAPDWRKPPLLRLRIWLPVLLLLAGVVPLVTGSSSAPGHVPPQGHAPLRKSDGPPFIASAVARSVSVARIALPDARATPDQPDRSGKADLLTPSFGILLGLVASPAAGHDLWRDATRRNSDLLTPLQPRYYEAARAKDHVLYGMVGGPFDTEAGAAATCATLQDRGVECSVAIYRGIRPGTANILSLASPWNGSPSPAAPTTP